MKILTFIVTNHNGTPDVTHREVPDTRVISSEFYSFLEAMMVNTESLLDDEERSEMFQWAANNAERVDNVMTTDDNNGRTIVMVAPK